MARGARPLSRVLLAPIFVVAGSRTFRTPAGSAAKASALGLPRAEALTRFNGAAMVLGGLALALGVLPRRAAAGLALSLVPTTLAGHRFWELDGADRSAQEIQFCKNLGLIGGLLLLATE